VPPRERKREKGRVGGGEAGTLLFLPTLWGREKDTSSYLGEKGKGNKGLPTTKKARRCFYCGAAVKKGEERKDRHSTDRQAEEEKGGKFTAMVLDAYAAR